MHVLLFGNKLSEEVCQGFIIANLFNSLYLLVRLWWNVLVANLATNFQDLVTKVKNLVALAPVLGTISRPAWWKKWHRHKNSFQNKLMNPLTCRNNYHLFFPYNITSESNNKIKRIKVKSSPTKEAFDCQTSSPS